MYREEKINENRIYKRQKPKRHNINEELKTTLTTKMRELKKKKLNQGKNVNRNNENRKWEIFFKGTITRKL